MRGPNLLLTGPPGIGKTTVIIRLAERLNDRALAGFYTEEVRAYGQRRGFRVTTFSGRTGTLADVRLKTRHRVGRYGVDLTGFEALVLPELERQADLMLIDEIGKMECFSPRFIDSVRRLLDALTLVVGTVALKGSGFIAEVKARPDVEIRSVSAGNRDALPQVIADHLAG